MANRKSNTSSPEKKAVSVEKVVKKKVTKVATKKVAVKKTKTAKTATTKVARTKTKSSVKQPLIIAPEGQSFWVTNGEVLTNLIELAESLSRMEARVFRYHADAERNDFSAWVEQVLLDAACAEALRKAKSASSANLIVVRHLKHYDI